MNTAAGDWRPTSDGKLAAAVTDRDGERLLESHYFKRKPVGGGTCRKPRCISECTAGTWSGNDCRKRVSHDGFGRGAEEEVEDSRALELHDESNKALGVEWDCCHIRAVQPVIVPDENLAEPTWPTEKYRPLHLLDELQEARFEAEMQFS